MGNPFERAVEEPKKRDEMLEDFLVDVEGIFDGLINGVDKSVLRRKFGRFFEESKKEKVDFNFAQNLMEANARLCEWLEQGGLEVEMKVKHGGLENAYYEEDLNQSKISAIHASVETFIADYVGKIERIKKLKELAEKIKSEE
ncbi:MAG: hypothetical protein Q7T51_03820 [Candidatus Moranbacteria bacterium]|nr:hypothetical protein [Candidatus Moranbacteria bacterium]